MGEFRSVDLGEFSFQEGKSVKKVLHDLRGDAGSASLCEICAFSHISRLEEMFSNRKKRRRWCAEKSWAVSTDGIFIGNSAHPNGSNPL
jgi:hypothetical protein